MNATVSPVVAASLADAERTLPFSDSRDFENAQRGFITPFGSGTVTDATGRVVWDIDGYDFLQQPNPGTVHPSLWRQSTLVAMHGLFEVVPGIYQVRGLDLSNVSFVEGDRGVIVIDPLISAETAAAALALYREHRGDRPVTAVIYSHSHIDHFGGVKGVTTLEAVAGGECAIIAPEGFMEHAVAENVYAGTAMARRAGYMYGAALTKGPGGQVGTGLGQTTSTGLAAVIPPTLSISRTGQEEVVDGVRIVFQLTPGTEAPSEMNFFFPDRAALCMAENANHTLHNTLTLRGALVRDPRVWARYLTEAIALFGDAAEVEFGSHHWPIWGHDELVEFISIQRDLYAYIHDQALRLINQGLVEAEIAEDFPLPPALENSWAARGYYGSVSHNVKSVYQRYIGWFDGNPAHLWEHPPVEAAKRYVTFMGGADEVVAKARQSFEEGDLRWVATVLSHVVFAEPEHAAGRALLADTLEQLGFGSENGTWRNFFLSGAHELRHGNFGTPVSPTSPDLLAALTVEQLFDTLSIRVNGPRAWDADLAMDWVVDDTRHRMTLRNGVLVHQPIPAESASAGTTYHLTRLTLLRLMLLNPPLEDLVAEGSLRVEGDPAVWQQLVPLLDAPNPDFAMVTP